MYTAKSLPDAGQALSDCEHPMKPDAQIRDEGYVSNSM